MSNLLEKVLVGVIAAGTLSVPLAGVAWGEPGADNPVGPGGVPVKIGESNGQETVPPGRGAALPQNDDPVPGVSDLAQDPGSVPEVIGQIGPAQVGPGQVIRAYTPGCVNGSVDCRS
jgi:hypothetical protein